LKNIGENLVKNVFVVHLVDVCIEIVYDVGFKLTLFKIYDVGFKLTYWPL